MSVHVYGARWFESITVHKHILMKIYISGKITGLPLHIAQEYFETIEQELKKANHAPVNPMNICPFDPAHTWQHYMKEDIRVLIDCEAIFMLDNWTDSRGAQLEHHIAKELGLKIYYANNHNLFKVTYQCQD